MSCSNWKWYLGEGGCGWRFLRRHPRGKSWRGMDKVLPIWKSGKRRREILRTGNKGENRKGYSLIQPQPSEENEILTSAEPERKELPPNLRVCVWEGITHPKTVQRHRGGNPPMVNLLIVD